MTPKQIELIRSSWEKVAPIADQAAALFYQRLFETDPSAHALFAGVDMPAQHQRLLTALGDVVGGLDSLGALQPVLQELGRRHLGYGVRGAHFDSVGAALLWTLEQGLGPAFTSEVREAWTAAYGLIAATMREAMEAERSAAA